MKNVVILPIRYLPPKMPFFCFVPGAELKPFESKYVYVPMRQVDQMVYLILQERLAGKIVVDEKGMILGGEKKLKNYSGQPVPVMKICGFTLREKRAFIEAHRKF